MKNIHILDTEKPSRLQLNVNTKKLILFDNIQSNNESVHLTTQHIYITSDEEIKKDEFYLGDDNHIYNLCTTVNSNGKKIILTTNEELIEEGIQAIDDEFLEWFVKNPSCEVIKVNKLCYGALSGFADAGYKIIIPKEEQKELRRKLLTLIESLEQEESKPHSFCETPNEKCTMSYCDENGCQNRKRILVEPKEETLEEEYYNDFKMIKGENIIEAAKRFWKESKANPIEMAIFGTKWQAERMYSDALEFGRWIIQNPDFQNTSSWSLETAKFNFEQFKKKEQ